MSKIERPDDPQGETTKAGNGTPASGGPEAWSARPVVRVSRRNLWLVITTGVVLLGLGVWLVTAKLPRLLNSPESAPNASAAVSAGTDARRILATLFYVSDDGGGLIQTRGAALYAGTPAEQARRILEAQVQPPPAGFRSAIPAGTTIRTVFLTANGQAFVDLGGTIVSGHSGGSLAESLTVYTIVNAVTVNLPTVSAVQILIEGRQVDTLAGHLDLRYPLSKGLDWVRKGP